MGSVAWLLVVVQIDNAHEQHVAQVVHAVFVKGFVVFDDFVYPLQAVLQALEVAGTIKVGLGKQTAL